MRNITKILVLILLLATLLPLFASPHVALAQTASSTPEARFGLSCFEFSGWTPSFHPGDCVALIGYYLLWYPTSLLLLLGATIFDTVAAWSFDATILNSTMVSTAWGTVRDIANLALIFALLYIAIATILQMGGVQLKRAVASVIIVGLLINFSLFVTRVVIDGSNILASGLYSKITAVSSTSSTFGTYSIGGVDVKSVSARIVAAFNPQKMLTDELVTSWRNSPDSGGTSSFFFVFVFAAILNLVATYLFLKAALLLVGRVVMFVFLMISSPLAFVASALPAGGGGFSKKWWSSLIDQALVAPVFFLFLYVITTVYSSSLIAGILSGPANNGFIPFLVNMALHFIVIIVALFIAIKITTGLAGEAGSYATKIGGAVVGGAVLGGAGYLARSTIGAGATRMAESNRFKEFAANNPMVGRWSKAGLDKVSGASFDLRNVKGIDDLGKGRRGGYTEDLKGRVKAREELGKHLGDLEVGTREVTKFRDKDQWRAHPSGATDSSGNIIMEKVKVREAYKENVPVTAKERYADNLGKTSYTEKVDEKGNIIKREPKDSAWARSGRQAAAKLRKGKPTLDKIKDALKEDGEIKEAGEEKPETPKEGGGEKKPE